MADQVGLRNFLTAPWRILTSKRLVRYLMRRLFRPRMVNIGGVVIEFTPELVSPAIVEQIYTEHYEEAEKHLVAALVEPGDVVLELGSGLGFISSVIGHRRPRQLVCVEANPRMVPLIGRNLANNGVTGVEILTGIVGPEDGEEDFFFGDHFIGSSLHRTDEHRGRLTVRRHAIGPLFARFDFNCLIIDIEGAEYELLEQLPLAGVAKLCIEFHPHIIGQAKVTEIVEGLIKAGFLLDLQQHSGQVQIFRRKETTARDQG